MKNSHLGHQARKRFGQNFLHDEYIINQIVRAISPQKGQSLLEIGPGLGALTEPVSELTDQLQVIEIDRDLAERLRQHPVLAPKLIVHEMDALLFDFVSNLDSASNNRWRIFGNLPYNISTPLIMHLLESHHIIQDMHFMLQKEVTERLAAGPNSKQYGRLSVMAQYYCQIVPVVEVPPSAFKPEPKVQSSVVRLIPYVELPHLADNITTLTTVCRLAFGQRRKTLRNSLGLLLDDSDWDALAIDPILRAENLSVAQYVAISNWLSQKKPPFTQL